MSSLAVQSVNVTERVSHLVLERNQMHLICAPGSSFTHMIDDTSVYPKQCHNEREYHSTLLHDQKS
jgi:hypothetical protein